MWLLTQRIIALCLQLWYMKTKGLKSNPIIYIFKKNNLNMCSKKHFSISLLNCKVINKKAWLALQMIQLTFAFKTGTNQPPLTNNRDVNSFIIAKAQIDANLWKLWHSSIDLGPGFRSFFVQEALVSYCSNWLMDLFCSHSVYCIASLPKLENNGRKRSK